MNDVEATAYAIADNRTGELAEWNYDLLPIELGELQSCNYDLGLLGFDADDLAKLLDPGGWEAPVTKTVAPPMTPEYASPEQVRGESITTASDAARCSSSGSSVRF